MSREAGPYVLSFTLPKRQWHVSEAIVGEAQVRPLGTAERVVSGPGEVIFGFEFAAEGGLTIRPVWPASCKAHVVRADAPLSTGILKSGGVNPLDPNAEAIRNFLRDPVLQLPAGTWRITAIADISEGPECEQPRSVVRLPVDIEVVD